MPVSFYLHKEKKQKDGKKIHDGSNEVEEVRG